MEMRRIILTGAHGTGKTTVLNLFKSTGYPTITEVVRKLNKEKGVKINEQGDGEGQQAIFNEYFKLLGRQWDYVSDRGLTDVLAYTAYLVKHGQIDQSVYEAQLKLFKKFQEENTDILYCFFPIEFEIEDDSVRSTKKEFQKEISDIIKHNLSICETQWIEVHGTPEERFRQILEMAGPNL